MEKTLDKIEWTKAAVLQMIKMWKANEFFYNTKHKFYTSRQARKNALDEMAVKLSKFIPGIKGSEVMNKMSYLRGQYTREIAKIKAKKQYVPIAYWFSELSFLEEFIKYRSRNFDNEWTKSAVLQMIKMWKANECFYNPEHKLYTNRQARKDALNKIAAKLNKFNPDIRADEVKNKMSCLRGQYTREIAKIKAMKNETNAIEYVPTAYWFSELAFLEEFINYRSRNLDSMSEDSFSQPTKKPKYSKDDDISQSSCELNQEEESTKVFQRPASSSEKKSSTNEKDEAFCNFLKAELNELTNVHIKDELIENIMLAVFEAKKKERMDNKNNENTNFYNYGSI